MPTPEIVLLNPEIEADFYALAAEYLPGSDPEKMKRFAEMFPEAFIALAYEGEIIGVAFGWLRSCVAPEDKSFSLDGIAVRYDHQKKGYGKLLLAEFEKAAAKYSSVVSVGSAGGYVEKFYIDCGFVPKEYKVWDGGGIAVEKTFDSFEDYCSYTRKNEDGFVVMVKRI